jgi:hypothetical protein
MRAHCEALLTKVHERIEYRTAGGEERIYNRVFPGLLAQLHHESTVPMASKPQGGGSPNPSVSRSPMNQTYADCIEQIEEEAVNEMGLWAEPCQCAYNLPHLLADLLHMVESNATEDLHSCRRTEQRARMWVRNARVLLGYETRKIALPDTVCGTCGGALIVAADASTDVQCIGTPTNPSCGMSYERLRWIDLL